MNAHEKYKQAMGRTTEAYQRIRDECKTRESHKAMCELIDLIWEERRAAIYDAGLSFREGMEQAQDIYAPQTEAV